MKIVTTLLLASLLSACGAYGEGDIRDEIADIEAAANDRDAKRVLAHMDEHFYGNGLHEQDMNRLVPEYFEKHPTPHFALKVEKIHPLGRDAFEVNVTAYGFEAIGLALGDPLDVWINFDRKGDAWKVTKVGWSKK